jgi:hypothetical protein
MSAPTLAINENCERIITLFRDGERVTHTFSDHSLSLHERGESGKGMLYYIVAHDYGTGEETLVFLKDKGEYDILDREMNRMPEAFEFKKSIEAYRNRVIGKDFVKVVEARRCMLFCDEWLKEQEALSSVPKKPVAVHGGFFTEPRISDEQLKELCLEPLKATTDPLKLKELEGRFPGATMVLRTGSRFGVVKYVYEDLYIDESANHGIACDFADCLPARDFASLGVATGQRPQLMAEWRGMYIDLSHLF